MSDSDLPHLDARTIARNMATSPHYRDHPLAPHLLGALDALEAMEAVILKLAQPSELMVAPITEAEALAMAEADPNVGEDFVQAFRRAGG